jgi:hypothetical protein
LEAWLQQQQQWQQQPVEQNFQAAATCCSAAAAAAHLLAGLSRDMVAVHPQTPHALGLILASRALLWQQQLLLLLL